jgi:hypothetical protein
MKGGERGDSFFGGALKKRNKIKNLRGVYVVEKWV